MNPRWLDFRRDWQFTSWALLSQQGHTGEQVECRAEQGEMDLQGHRLIVQATTWPQEIQSGLSLRPDDDTGFYCCAADHATWDLEKNFIICISHFVWPKLIAGPGPGPGPGLQPRRVHVGAAGGARTAESVFDDLLFPVEKDWRDSDGSFSLKIWKRHRHSTEKMVRWASFLWSKYFIFMIYLLMTSESMIRKRSSGPVCFWSTLLLSPVPGVRYSSSSPTGLEVQSGCEFSDGCKM